MAILTDEGGTNSLDDEGGYPLRDEDKYTFVAITGQTAVVQTAGTYPSVVRVVPKIKGVRVG